MRKRWYNFSWLYIWLWSQVVSYVYFVAGDSFNFLTHLINVPHKKMLQNYMKNSYLVKRNKLILQRISIGVLMLQAFSSNHIFLFFKKNNNSCPLLFAWLGILINKFSAKFLGNRMIVSKLAVQQLKVKPSFIIWSLHKNHALLIILRIYYNRKFSVVPEKEYPLFIQSGCPFCCS